MILRRENQQSGSAPIHHFASLADEANDKVAVNGHSLRAYQRAHQSPSALCEAPEKARVDRVRELVPLAVSFAVVHPRIRVLLHDRNPRVQSAHPARAFRSVASIVPAHNSSGRWPNGPYPIASISDVRDASEREHHVVRSERFLFGRDNRLQAQMVVAPRSPVQQERQSGHDKRAKRNPIAEGHSGLQARVHQSMAFRAIQGGSAA